MTVERGSPAFLKKVTCLIALTASFLYYVTFVQMPLMEAAFCASPTWIFAFGLLAALGCLTAGNLVDLRLGGDVAAYLPLMAVCMAAEGAFGLAWPASRMLMPVLGFALGFHIVLLFVLLGVGLSFEDRAMVASFAVAAIYLCANLMVFRGGTGLERSGRTTGAVLLLAALAVLVAWRTDMVTAGDAAAPKPQPGNPFKRALPLLVPLFLLIALDSFVFRTLIASESWRQALFPTPGHWIANGVYHALAALAALAVLVRYRTEGALVGSAVCGAAFLLLAALGNPSPHAGLAIYSLFVGLYTVALFTLWPRVWTPARIGRTTALGMMIAGFGGSVGGIGLSLLASGL